MAAAAGASGIGDGDTRTSGASGIGTNDDDGTAWISGGASGGGSGGDEDEDGATAAATGACRRRDADGAIGLVLRGDRGGRQRHRRQRHARAGGESGIGTNGDDGAARIPGCASGGGGVSDEDDDGATAVAPGACRLRDADGEFGLATRLAA